jgi:hypothetical protein
MAETQSKTADHEALRERLALALAAEWPSKALIEKTSQEGGEIVLRRPGKGDRIPGIWVDGKGPAALIVNVDGAKAALQTREAKEWIAARRPLLAIDAYQTGSAAASREQPGRQHLIFNKSDAANRVQDILTGIAFLSAAGHSPVTLLGRGDAAVWCVFAAAVSKGPVEVKADIGSFQGKDSDFIEHFFVPGIQRAGGWSAAMLLAHPGPL